jgi:hypothetical protein
VPRIRQLALEALALVLSMVDGMERGGQKLEAQTRSRIRDEARATIRGLSDPCRHELAVMLSGDKPLPTTGTTLVAELAPDVVVPAGRLPVPLRRLMDRSFPAPDRSWAAGDLAYAIGILEKLDRKDLPRRDDRATGAIFARLVSLDPLLRLEDAPLSSHVNLTAKVIGSADRLRAIYTPALRPPALPVATAEGLGCDELLVAALAAHARIESLARSRPEAVREDPQLAQFVAGSTVELRGKVLHSLINGLEQGPAAPSPAQVSFAEAMARALPDIRPTLSAGARASAALRLKALAVRYPDGVKKRLLAALAD